jgi:hypothetical protein
MEGDEVKVLIDTRSYSFNSKATTARTTARACECSVRAAPANDRRVGVASATKPVERNQHRRHGGWVGITHLDSPGSSLGSTEMRGNRKTRPVRAHCSSTPARSPKPCQI